mgnify:CR=1 FL=1
MSESQPLRPGDYYMEGKMFVLTAEYHRRRGYCCESGCRHCPYGFKKETLTVDWKTTATPGK